MGRFQVDRLSESVKAILTGRTAIKAATTQTQTQEFQSE
jgi:hypothetical protein